MRYQFIKAIIVLVCLTVVPATAVKGQGTHRFAIEIPFQFVLADRTLPAGKYSIERIDAARPNVLLLKNRDNGKLRLIIAHRSEKDEPSTTSTLLFRREGEKLFLFQVWIIGDKNGNQVPLADQGKAGRKPESSTIVRLSVNQRQ